MQSDTPRTDAENYIYGFGLRRWVSIEFARQLERELAEMRQQRDEARRELCRVIGYQRQDWFDATAIAAERGWDCFAQQEGGGA